MPSSATPTDGASRMDWRRQLAEGRLVCPRSRQPLVVAAGGGELASRDGSARYPILGGRLPCLHAEQAALEAAGRITPSDIALPPRRGLAGLVGSLRERFPSDYRTRESTEALSALMDGVGPDALCLSVGGGPNRPNPRFVNLNLAPDPGVDILADAHRLPYADGRVDAVFSEAVLEHLRAPAAAVAEMYRVLAPGRRAYAITPFLQAYHGHPWHYQNFTREGHRLLFESAGFRVIAEGACVGPVHTLLTLAGVFMRQYLPAGRYLAGAWSLVSLPIHPLDRLINEREDAHVMASTCYLLAEKPTLPGAGGDSPEADSVLADRTAGERVA